MWVAACLNAAYRRDRTFIVVVSAIAENLLTINVKFYFMGCFVPLICVCFLILFYIIFILGRCIVRRLLACSRLLRQAGPEVALVLGQDGKLGEFGGRGEDRRSPSLRILVEAALQKIKNNYQLFKGFLLPICKPAVF